MRSDIPKFASNNKNTGTDAENKAVVQGTIANYGTYKVDEENHKASVHFIGSTYPNWSETDQERTITITGNQMTWVDPATPFGGTGTVTLTRAE
jgi:Lipocalin-like domain